MNDLNENVRISIKISLKFISFGPINNIPALVQIMAWRRPDDKPLSEPMMVRLPTHICITRPQWIKCVAQKVLKRRVFDGFGKLFEISISPVPVYINTAVDICDAQPTVCDKMLPFKRQKAAFQREISCKPHCDSDNTHSVIYRMPFINA